MDARKWLKVAIGGLAFGSVVVGVGFAGYSILNAIESLDSVAQFLVALGCIGGGGFAASVIARDRRTE